MLRHGLGSIVDQLGYRDVDLSPGVTQVDRQAARLGRRLALALTDLGPTFVKLGQVLSTRDDLLPPAVTTELVRLQQHVRPVEGARVRQELERTLRAPLRLHFAHFDERPLASASIAQVHRARTVGGEDVVVKVRRPGLVARVEEDLGLLGRLAEIVEERIEEARPLAPRQLVAEFAGSLRHELDFRHEAAALARMREVVGVTARVPRVHEPLCTEALLTLEYLDGARITDVQGAARRRMATQLLSTFVHQVLGAGFFHGDPHPGNLLALPGSSVGLLDLGSVGELTEGMQRDLVRMARAAVARDGPGLAEAMTALLQPPGPTDPEGYRADVGAFLDRLLAEDLRQIRFGDIAQEVWGLVRAHQLRLEPGYFRLLRAGVTLDGVLRELDPTLDPLHAARADILRVTVTSPVRDEVAALGADLVQQRMRFRLLRKLPRWAPAAVVAGGLALVAGLVFAMLSL